MVDKKKISHLVLFIIMAALCSHIVLAQSLGGIENLLLNFNGILNLYETSPLFFDAVLIFMFFLSLIQWGLKKGASNMDNKFRSGISVSIGLLITFSFVFWLKSKGTSLFQVGGPILTTIIIITSIVIVLTILFRSFGKEHRATIIFSSLFVVHFILINAIEAYGNFLEDSETIGGLVSLIVLISGIFLFLSIIGLLMKAFTKGKANAISGLIKSKKEMEEERKYDAQKEEKEVKDAGRKSKRLLRRESSKIDQAKEILGEIVRLLSGDWSGNIARRNITELRKKVGELRKLSVGIGAYVGLANNLSRKIQKYEDIEKNYGRKLMSISRELLKIEHQINNAIANFVESCKGDSIDPKKARELAKGLDNKFSYVLKWSEGLAALEREIYEELEKRR